MLKTRPITSNQAGKRPNMFKTVQSKNVRKAQIIFPQPPSRKNSAAATAAAADVAAAATKAAAAATEATKFHFAFRNLTGLSID